MTPRIQRIGKRSRTVAALLAVGGILWPVTGMAGERALTFVVPGVVAEVLVKRGQKVAAGAVLARLDARPLEARKRAAEARLKAAAVGLELATRHRARIKQLFDDLSTSGEELERADLALAQARAMHARARARVDLAAWRLDRATLRASGSGIVKAVPGYPGMVVDSRARITPVVVLEVRDLK